LEPTDALLIANTFLEVYSLLKDIGLFLKSSKRGELKKLFGSKKETIERKFKEALMVTKNTIESCIWYGKGYALAGKCGSKVDRNFHYLMGRVINVFNNIHLRLDPEKLDDRLKEHLLGQIKILEKYANHLLEIQGISNHTNPEEEAIKIIEDLIGRLRDFETSMEPYLKPQS